MFRTPLFAVLLVLPGLCQGGGTGVYIDGGFQTNNLNTAGGDWVGRKTSVNVALLAPQLQPTVAYQVRWVAARC